VVHIVTETVMAVWMGPDGCDEWTEEKRRGAS